MRLFVDLDGVLADFDSHHEVMFGVRSSLTLGNIDWDAVHACGDFYQDMPPMVDFSRLWAFIEQFEPVVLTGISTPAENKRAWVRRNVGTDVEVRCAQASEKYKQARPGDVLIDDWEKYRDLWLATGGRWITHRTAGKTIDELLKLGIG